MNVLMVTSSYPKFPGDVTAPFIESIARGVAARGHAVDVVLPYHPDFKRVDESGLRFFPYRYAPRDEWSLWGYAQSLEADVRVRLAVYPLAPLVALALRRAVAARLEDRRYDVAHVQWVVPNAVMLRDVLRSQAVPLVVSLHGSDVFVAERTRLAGALARPTLRAAGAITACSADLRRRALRLGAPPDRTRTVPYGVDLEAFAPGRADLGFRERWGVPAGAMSVLAVGRLVEKKGFRFLIEAAARANGVHVVVAGEGTLRQELEALAVQVGAPVSFAGSLDRETVAAAVAAADVVAIPSIVDRAGNVDGLPNTLLEAMAAGRAIVASRVAGIPDVIEDEKNGLLVPEKDEKALATALLRLAKEPETRARLGREARRLAVHGLSWEAAAQAFEDCYAQAAALEAR